MHAGQRRYQNGTQVLTAMSKQAGQLEDQKKRWEDEINEFLKTEESEESKGNDLKNNDTLIRQAKKQKEWNLKEEAFSKKEKQHQQKIQGPMS